MHHWLRGGRPGNIFMHFQASITEVDSFGGLNPEISPLMSPWVQCFLFARALKTEDIKKELAILHSGQRLLDARNRIHNSYFLVDIALTLTLWFIRTIHWSSSHVRNKFPSRLWTVTLAWVRIFKI